MHMPSLFVMGHGDAAMSVQAMKTGAVNFLANPFLDQDLLVLCTMRWRLITAGVAKSVPAQAVANLLKPLKTANRVRPPTAALAEITDTISVSTDAISTKISNFNRS
jgi:FixJ family two-component response regulator